MALGQTQLALAHVLPHHAQHATRVRAPRRPEAVAAAALKVPQIGAHAAARAPVARDQVTRTALASDGTEGGVPHQLQFGGELVAAGEWAAACGAGAAGGASLAV